MGTALLPGDPPVEITLRRSARARRISLRVSRLDGRVTLSHPAHVREAEAMAFAREKADWIRRQLAATVPGTALGFGGAIPVEGEPRHIVPGPGRLVRLDGARILVPGAEPQVGTRLAAYLRLLARDRLTEASDRHAAALGRGYTTLALRDTRSRWGSCGSGGRLMYSWRLAMAPPAVLDYVAAHEVAHLREMNHSPAFWRLVARLCPDHAQHRAWLRSEGHRLHAIRF